MSKQQSLRGLTASLPTVAANDAKARKKTKRWWHQRTARFAPHYDTLIANGGEVFVGRRLEGAYVWIDAESVPAIPVANDRRFNK